MAVFERFTGRRVARPVRFVGIKWDIARMSAMQFGDQTGAGKPVRLHPNTPPVRDAEHQRKHELRKISNASRRRNRS